MNANSSERKIGKTNVRTYARNVGRGFFIIARAEHPWR